MGVVITVILLYRNMISIGIGQILYLSYALFGFVFFAFYYHLGEAVYYLPRLGSLILVWINFYILAYQVWDFKRCFELYKKICLFCSVAVTVQFVCGSMGHGFCLMPPGLKTTGDFETTDLYAIQQIATNRFSSFFLEPAHQAQYCMPCVAILLFSEKDKHYLRIALVISIGIVATTS